MKRNSHLPQDADLQPASVAAASPRRGYQPPRIIHEADLEVRAGSPLVAPDDPRQGQPWYQETGQQSFP